MKDTPDKAYLRMRLLNFGFLLSVLMYYLWIAGKIPLQLWDESRLAVNAFEMTRNGNWFTTFYNNAPDFWNTKPPLMIWFIAGSFKLLGYTEWTLRLPSVVFAMLTLLLLVIFCNRYLKNVKLGFFSAFILFSSTGFSGWHIALTGDYEAMLVFWTFLYSLIWFIWVHEDKKGALYPFSFFLVLSLAVLTKSISGLLFMPMLLGYAIYRRKAALIFKNPWAWLGGVLFLVVVCSYYLLQERFTPGYLKAVWTNELGGRYLGVLEGHQHPFYYYLVNLFSRRFIVWSFFLTASFFLIRFVRDETFKQLSIFAAVCVTGLLLIISMSGTKLRWYDAQIYPFAALLAGSAFLYILGYLRTSSKKRLKVAGYCFMGGSMAAALACMLIINTKLINQNHLHIQYLSYMEELRKRKPELKTYTVLINEYHADILFYAKRLSLENYHIDIVSSSELNGSGKTILVSDPVLSRLIRRTYKYEVVDSSSRGKLYHLKKINTFALESWMNEQMEEIRSYDLWHYEVVQGAKKHHVP